MYYPIGWHKVLKLDLQSNQHGDQQESKILSVQANHERELFFILTNDSIHIWYTRPAVEIVAHRRSAESIKSIGYNRLAVWRPDSTIIVVATDRDQLLFYQIRRRYSSNQSFLIPSSNSDDFIYRLKYDNKQFKSLFKDQKKAAEVSFDEGVPSLTIFSFGKIDLSGIGVSCLMSAQEELVVGAVNGEIYGIQWNGNVDFKFPWSLKNDVESGKDYVRELKFSSILSGFVIVFNSGRAGFLPIKATRSSSKNGQDAGEQGQRSPRLQYISIIENAVCVEINHKYRLVAFGLHNSKIIVCTVGDADLFLVVNHELDIVQQSKMPQSELRIGPIRSMRYSPDGTALVTSWAGGDFAIWSVFGSLVFHSRQWQSESRIGVQLHSNVLISSLEWGREGLSIWLSTIEFEDGGLDDANDVDRISGKNSNPEQPLNVDALELTTSMSKLDIRARKQKLVILTIARSSLSSSPHLACSSDAIVLISEERLYVGPSVPHKAEFDNWLTVDIPQSYLKQNFPIRYATVDRDCQNMAIAGTSGFALFSLASNKWRFFKKPSQAQAFNVCGDLMWWQNYVIASCYNNKSQVFELRAYPVSEELDDTHCVTQQTQLEIARMSIFENRLLTLQQDGNLRMFMLNLRPKFGKSHKQPARSNSTVGISAQTYAASSSRSDSVISLNNPIKQISQVKDVTLQISPIENLIISNLQANAYCISAIALTRLHFKNSRSDDSILLNACGKLFLLERDAASGSLESSPSPTAVGNQANAEPNNNDATANANKFESNGIIKIQSAKRLTDSKHFASASIINTVSEPTALANVTFKAVSVIATDVEQFWISPEISLASELSYFRRALWLSCGCGVRQNAAKLHVWLPLLNDNNDAPTDLYVPERIMLPIKCDIYPLTIRSSAPDVVGPDDAIVLGAENDIIHTDTKTNIDRLLPYFNVKRQCRVYLHRILRELLLNKHLGYYARKIAESCQPLPYFSHCFELLLHEVLEEEATSPVPLPDPMLPQIIRFMREFPVYLETVVHCARKSELSMWSYLFDERAVGHPRRLLQECLEKRKLDTAASCLIILQSLDRNIISQKMVRDLIEVAKNDDKYSYLVEDLNNFLSRAELDTATSAPNSPQKPSGAIT